MSVRIIQGDCLVELGKLAYASVDSCVTDPPYGLKFMGKLWDHGIPAAPYWSEVLRVLKPGAHLLAFGGTRTYHRLACAIEDAGFEIRDQIGWAFGSGFPKSHNGPWGGTALKPAWEPIVMARKPLVGTVAANVQQYGTGGLNIDECRVETSRKDQAYIMERVGGFNNTQSIGGNGKYSGGETMDRAENYDATKGRWPANLIHDGSDEVLACFPDNAGAFAPVRGTESSRPAKNTYGKFARSGGSFPGDGLGSAARFFYCAKASREDRNEGLRGMAMKPLNWSSGEQSPGTFQSPNTNRQAQNHHPTVKPTDLMRYLCRLVTPNGGTILDPFMGSGSTGRGAIREGFGFIGIEIDPEYCEIARIRIHADAPLFAEVGS